jgi:hypothetical protein
MESDIKKIIKQLNKLCPHLSIFQFSPLLDADDNGLWLISYNGIGIQLESSSGNCPFLLESNEHNTRYHLNSINEVISKIETELNLSEK